MKDVFEDIYQNNKWLSDESVSGGGSTLDQTEIIRQELPTLFAQLGIKSMLDIPCGDFNWFSKMDLGLIDVIGADIVADLVYTNDIEYGSDYYSFQVLDISTDELPKVDLILCRDLLGHFSNRDVQRAIRNLKASGSTYLLATTFPDHETVHDIWTGQWRPINLASFFGLPDPIKLINEGCTEGGGQFIDKSLGLWKLQEEEY